MKFEKIHKLRANFLKSLYTTCNADSERDVDMFELGEKLGIAFDDILKIVSYLNQERLVSHIGIGPLISISHTGIKRVEGLLDLPEHGRAGNFITIGTMQNSAIQQGSPNAQQTFTLTQHNQAQLQSFLQELESSKMGTEKKFHLNQRKCLIRKRSFIISKIAKNVNSL